MLSYLTKLTIPFNYFEYPTDILLLVVLYWLRYKLSLRDVAEMFLERGFELTYEAVRDWEARFASLIADQLRVKRRGQVGVSWLSMKSTSKSKETGVIRIVPLIVTGTWNQMIGLFVASSSATIITPCSLALKNSALATECMADTFRRRNIFSSWRNSNMDS